MIHPRSKPRPNRLKGHDMAVLRAQVFERDGYRCQHVPWPRTFPDMRCMRRVTWEKGQLAHIKVKRMGGDTPENTYCCCELHHRIYHAYGPSMTKPCKKKEAA